MKRRFIVLGFAVSLIVLLICSACQTGWQGEDRDFRQDMRNFVQSLSEYAKARSTGFVIIPQNGHALITTDGEPDGTPATKYLAAIDGVGREDLNYGYVFDNAATPAADRDEMMFYLDIAEAAGVEVLVTDYCSDHVKMDDSYTSNEGNSYISFAADSRNLDRIPDYPAVPYNSNTAPVPDLAGAKNFLYLLDPALYTTKANYLSALGSTDYDLIIMDLFYEDGTGTVHELTSSDLAQIDTKTGGADRLLICYMSIGEAEDYRYYWDPAWEQNPPEWLEEENPNWKGNYKVQYWEADWQAIIFGGSNSYLDKILAAGFDGVYLDIIDAYEYFEG